MFDMERHCVAAEIALLLVLRGSLQGECRLSKLEIIIHDLVLLNAVLALNAPLIHRVRSMQSQTVPHGGATIGIKQIPCPSGIEA